MSGVGSPPRVTQNHRDMSEWIEKTYGEDIEPKIAALVLKANREWRESPERREQRARRKAEIEAAQRRKFERAQIVVESLADKIKQQEQSSSKPVQTDPYEPVPAEDAPQIFEVEPARDEFVGAGLSPDTRTEDDDDWGDDF